MYKKVFALILALLMICLAACGQTDQPEPTEIPTQPTQAQTVPVTEPLTEAPTVPPTEPPTQAPTQPPHSALYIPGLDVEDVIVYFNEVALDAESFDSGDPSRLQRWTTPIFYHVYGDPTDEDLAVLEDFAAWLNTILSFPGIYEIDDPSAATMRIHFTDQDGLLDIMGSDFTGLDGAVTFWYDNDEIYDCTICIRTDIGQYVRNSVILEEVYNGLGPIQDTSLREDSLIYSGYSEPQELTDIDELLLRLLYHPDLKSGMDAEECEAIIREIYY